MAIAFVAEANADGGFAASTTLTYSSTAGNTLVLYVASNGANTVTDTAGNTWTMAADTASAGATSQRVGQVYYCINAAAITSVTITRASSSNWSLKMTEWSGVDAFGVAAVTSGATAPTITTLADDMVIAGAFYFSGSPTTASGYTGLPAVGQRLNFNIYSQYRLAPTSGNYNPTLGLSSAGWITISLAPPATPSPESHFRLVGTEWVPVAVSIVRPA